MLEIRNIDAFYDESHILHAVSLSVGAGQRVAILGRNGAGKSTLLKSVMNGGPRTVGSIDWAGKPLGDTPSFRRARQGMMLVPEDRRIFTHITVTENIAMAHHAATADRLAIEPNEILRRFPMLQPLAQRLGGQLSGGQQQMLAVARAVAARPRLLLLDEPTEGLAPVIVEQLAKDVRNICIEDGIGLLLSEQNVWFARACADQVYVIDTGRIAFHGDWESFDRQGVAQKHLAV